jgi:hypothetical protein
MEAREGGCLCSSIRYRVDAPPVRVTICHCRFCQRATGSAYMVEPVFERSAFAITTGSPRVYDHRSTGSGKTVRVNFCPTCGTKLFLAFERFPAMIGVYGGTFDDPDWFDRAAENARHIFVDSAQRGTVIPAGVAVFGEHAIDSAGNPLAPRVLAAPHVVGSDGNTVAMEAQS